MHPPFNNTLFVSFTYPTFAGSGSQKRAASLVEMLIMQGDVCLLVIHQETQSSSAVIDHSMDRLCRAVYHLHVVQSAEPDEAAQEYGIQITCKPGQVASTMRGIYEQYHLQQLFVFRIETYCLMEGGLNFYPVKYIDLDELSSRRNQLIDDLKQKTGAMITNQNSAQRGNRLLGLLEKKVIPEFDHVFAASAFEANEICFHTNCSRINVLPNVLPEVKKRFKHTRAVVPEILFVGSFFYYPNEDAVHYFVNAIFPIIYQRLQGNVRFCIVGFSASESVRSLADYPGVVCYGAQDDLTTHYAKASLVVVPLRAGTGTRIKIIEAFTQGCPVVSTSIGAAGLHVTSGDDIILADTSEAFAEACLNVLHDPILAERLIQGGYQLHQRLYSLRALARHYRAAINLSNEKSLPFCES